MELQRCLCSTTPLRAASSRLRSASACSRSAVAATGSLKVGGTRSTSLCTLDVLRRHRKVVIVGVVLTVALAVLSVVRVSPSGISYRSPETWSNQATLVLTQEGAPELRSVLPARPGGFSPSLADTGRFAGLIDVYAATLPPVMPSSASSSGAAW